MADVVLRAGRARAVRRRHPWVLAGAEALRLVNAEAGQVPRVPGPAADQPTSIYHPEGAPLSGLLLQA